MNSNQLVYINPKKYYLVYKTTNLINHFIYIGVHCTNKLDDGYLGSGTNILKAIKEFGKENFIREILFFCNSKEEMLQKEKEFVTNEFRNRKDTYNKNVGGGGKFNALGLLVSQETRTKISLSNLGKKMSKESIQKGLETKKVNGNNKPSIETKNKMSLSRKKYLKENPIIMSNQTRKKISETVSQRHKQGNYFSEKYIESKRKQMIENNPMQNAEYRKKISNALKGRIYIKNIELQKTMKIYNNELQHFLTLGWVKGRYVKP